MSVRYELACQCGRKFPVETSQAGQELSCECGATLKIPTMMKIKRLPVWSEGDGEPTDAKADGAFDSTANQESAPTDAKENVANETNDGGVQTQNVAKRGGLSSRRLGMFLVGGAILVVSAFFFCRDLKAPNPLDVFYKRQVFAADGKAIRRDSSPIEQSDVNFYFLYEPSLQATYLVDDNIIDSMSVFYAYRYLECVRDVNLSDNFYDNYESLKIRRTIRLVGFGVAAALGLAIAFLALFLPEKQKQVGRMRGSDWR